MHDNDSTVTTVMLHHVTLEYHHDEDKVDDENVTMMETQSMV